jgi:hypothetical protein
MTGAEPGCVSEQDGVAGSGCGVRSALKCCNTEAVAGACGARGGARGGGEGGQHATEEGERIEALGLWLARARIRPDERSRAGWLCGFFL